MVASELFPDPAADILKLKGLLNSSNVYIFVDASSSLKYTGNFVIKEINAAGDKGIFLDTTATKMTPVQSLHDAIMIA